MSRKYVTCKALNEILNAWANIGPDEARAIAIKHDIRPTYVKQLASDHKVKAKRKPTKKQDRASDPRWKWAIERGPVIA